MKNKKFLAGILIGLSCIAIAAKYGAMDVWGLLRVDEIQHLNNASGVYIESIQMLNNTIRANAFYAGGIELVNGGGTSVQSNILINGNFAVWQRGTTSATISTTRTYLPDRFAIKTGAGTLTTAARSTTVPAGSRSKYSLELTGATGVSTVTIDQRIEAMNVPKSTVYFSAYIYNGSGTAFTPKLYVSTPAASDDWTTPTVINGSGSGENLQECADSAWTKVYWTADISGYSNIDNGVEFKLEIPSGSLVSADTVNIADMILTYGSSYVEPLVKSHPETLLDCRRYCHSFNGLSQYEPFAQGLCFSTTVAQIIIPHNPPLRAASSSISFSSATDFGLLHSAGVTSNASDLALSPYGGVYGSKIVVTMPSVLTAGAPAVMVSYNTDAVLIINAEL